MQHQWQSDYVQSKNRDIGDDALCQPDQHNIFKKSLAYRPPSCAEDDIKQCRLHFNIKMLKKTKYDLPWMKERSQNTKQAISMVLWQDIAVLRDTVVSHPRLAFDELKVIFH